MCRRSYRHSKEITTVMSKSCFPLNPRLHCGRNSKDECSKAGNPVRQGEGNVGVQRRSRVPALVVSVSTFVASALAVSARLVPGFHVATVDVGSHRRDPEANHTAF